MPSAPFVVPPLLLIVTLVVSAVAKLRDPRDTSSVFLQLRLPRVLLRLRVPRLLPYGELVLAALLLLAPGAWYVVAATATLLLFVAYFLVILRAVRLPYPVRCGCFGRLGLGEVTRRTLARNGVLLALALVTWVDAWRTEGVARRLGGLGGWAWALAATAVVAAAALTFVARARSRTTPPEDDADPTGYRPAPAPHGLLHGPEGPVPVRDLTDVAARFLVFGDPASDPGLLARASTWDARLAPGPGARRTRTASGDRTRAGRPRAGRPWGRLPEPAGGCLAGGRPARHGPDAGRRTRRRRRRGREPRRGRGGRARGGSTAGVGNREPDGAVRSA